MSTDVPTEIAALDSTLKSIESVLDLDSKRNEIQTLEAEAGKPNLWDDPDAAQAITSKLSRLQSEVRSAEQIRQKLDDVSILLELAEAEDDADTHVDVLRELGEVRKQIDELEVRTLLSGE